MDKSDRGEPEEGGQEAEGLFRGKANAPPTSMIALLLSELGELSMLVQHIKEA